jgi:multidrug efflux pump subunit AcrA (membrane-fusion protein)
VRKPLAALLSASILLLSAVAAPAAEFVVRPVTVTVMKSVFGQVRSRDILPARARIGGTIVEIAVEEGDEVKAGDVIASVVDAKLALQLDALDARIKAVSAQLDNAKTNLARALELFSRGTIAKSRLDELQTQADELTNARSKPSGRSSSNSRRKARSKLRQAAGSCGSHSVKVRSSCPARPSPRSPAAAIFCAFRCPNAMPAASQRATR